MALSIRVQYCIEKQAQAGRVTNQVFSQQSWGLRYVVGVIFTGNQPEGVCGCHGIALALRV